MKHLIELNDFFRWLRIMIKNVLDINLDRRMVRQYLSWVDKNAI